MDKLYFKRELYKPSILIESLHKRRELTKGREDDIFMNATNYRKDVSNEEVLRLHDAGYSISKICKETGLSYSSVRFRLAKLGGYRPTR